MLIVRDALEIDAMSLSPRLNKADKYAIEVCNEREVEAVLLEEVRRGCKSVIDNDTKMCYALFGDDHFPNTNPQTRLVWFMVSEDFFKDKKRMIQFVREYKIHVKQLLDKYSLLANYFYLLPTDEDNNKYKRIIEFMGFKFTTPINASFFHDNKSFMVQGFYQQKEEAKLCV